jgi:hypothetical protein
MDEIDITVTVTEKELAFRERAREAGLPTIVVSMYAGALQRLVDKERRWVGLTDNEIALIVGECAASHRHDDVSFARALEAKLWEKNGG